jgi:hypothetical protein
MSLTLPRALRRSSLVAVVALLSALLTIVDAPAAPAAPTNLTSAAAAAAPTDPVYHAVSGGSRVNVAGAVRSDLTAASSLRVETAPRQVENKTADVDVLDGLIEAEAVQSDNRTTNVPALLGGGIQVSSKARIAGLSLLNGLITAQAIETTATATINDAGEVKRSGSTRLIGVKIGDKRIPINVPKNTGIVIPGVVSVVVNRVRGQLGGDALIKSEATGLFITLLKPQAGLSAGASIELTPTMARILLPVPIDGEPAFGYAYSTRVGVHVGDAVKVRSAPTAVIICPAGGTNGADLTNGTARVLLPGVAKANALANTANATVTDAETDATMTAKIGAVDLLNGLITLDAVVASAHVNQVGSNAPTKRATSKVLGLSIGGKEIPVKVRKNTVVEVPGLVKVIINEQTNLPFPYNGIAVRALHIIALPGAPEDIAGIDIEVGVAGVWVNR